MTTEKGKRFGKYAILGEIGLGGMGNVYQARNTRTGRSVAIKVLPAEYLNDLGLRASFERESEMIAALKHKAILRVYEFGEQDGQPFLVMAYMPNGSLEDRLAHGPLAAGEALPILDRIAKALDYAHKRGIVHLDLKPSNILLDHNDRAFLADFGIAWQAASSSSVKGNLRGTPAYISPEQAQREETIDGRSDLYSLGIIAFEMLTGVQPFEGDSPLAVILKHIHDQSPSIRAVNPDLPPALDEVIQRSMAKDPQDRFPSGRSFIQAFRKSLKAIPAGDVSPEPVPPPGRTQGSSLPILLDDPSAQTLDLKAESPEELQSEGETRVSPGREDKNKHKRDSGWQARHLIALGAASWLGLLLAILLVVAIRVVQASSTVNVRMTYDQAGVNLINLSEAPLDLNGVTFQRTSADGTVQAVFSTTVWSRLPAQTGDLLPPGDCYQLLHPEAAALKLNPGKPLPKPGGCRRLSGWLVALDQNWLFWTPEGEGSSFQILQDSQVIHTCKLVESPCEFYLPQPVK